MVNLVCVICVDLLEQTDNVYGTLCGHMFHYSCLKQWLERSESCPQCRTACSEHNIVRLYFHLDPSFIDPLEEQLDRAEFEIEIKNNKIQGMKEEIELLKESQENYIKTITNLQSKLQTKDKTILDRVDQLKAQEKVSDDLQKEVEILRQRIYRKSDKETKQVKRIAELKRELCQLDKKLKDLNKSKGKTLINSEALKSLFKAKKRLNKAIKSVTHNQPKRVRHD